jgi:hypothetical protein
MSDNIATAAQISLAITVSLFAAGWLYRRAAVPMLRRSADTNDTALGFMGLCVAVIAVAMAAIGLVTAANLLRFAGGG